MFSLRSKILHQATRSTLAQPRLASLNAQRSFHSSPLLLKMVKVGDSIPSVELMEGSPGDKINLAEKLKGKGMIIGVPAAFSPGCSETHIPGYVNSTKTKAAGDVYVVAVNDAFVMKAWGKQLDPEGSSKMHFVADPSGAFTKALGLDFDASAMLGNVRSKRYALVIDGGKVVSTHVEPDNIGINESAAEKVLGK
ncbi:MAG: hypothetical protein M1828_006968 [Chrysothrix sp. TS-e1954]|nr:MAG: hypothetical protein M1828_006968 [Chrysothrix sp. TS-e1954]